MQISGGYQEFLEFLAHRPTRGAAIFLYKRATPASAGKVEKILVEDREWIFTPISERPLIAEIRRLASAAIEVVDWTL